MARSIRSLFGSRRPGAVSSKDAVVAAYRLVLGREPDLDGMVTFSTQLEQGIDVGSVIAQIALSEEFRATLHTAETPMSRTAAEFVVRLMYALVLRRTADEEGLDAWVRSLLAGTPWYQALNTMIASEELQGKLEDPAFWDGLDLLSHAADLVQRVQKLEERLERLNARQLDGEAVHRRLAALEDAVAAQTLAANGR